MSMTAEEAIKQAIRCAVGGCSEDCPYCDSDNVCHASEGFVENLENALSEFRELKEKATAKKPIPLDKNGEYHECPTCGYGAENYLGCGYRCCPNCGTKFDWSEGKE